MFTLKKLLTLVLAALMTLTIATSAQAKRPLDRACRFQLNDGRYGWTVAEVKQTIRCAERRWDVSGGVDVPLYIGWRESRYHQHATSYTGCKGIFQWSPTTWSHVLRDFPPLYKVLGHGIYNARSNVMYAVKYMHTRGLSPWR